MQDFKKILCSFCCFLSILIVASLVLIVPYENTEGYHYRDADLRSKLAGSLDFLVIGASQALEGFDTRILDRELGCNSYNLAAEEMPLYGTYWLLEKEMVRNPVKTVVLEISEDRMIHDRRKDHANGDIQLLQRMDSLSERLNYLRKYVAFETWFDVYSRGLLYGSMFWRDTITGRATHIIDMSLKGFYPRESVDVTLSPTRARILHEQAQARSEFQPLAENVEQLRQIIELCKQYDARMIIVVVPLSDAQLWEQTSWDQFSAWIKSFCREQNCELYDGNLFKNRYELFNDRCSFMDITHLSRIGAETFTAAFCDVLCRVDCGEDISKVFYNSYAEMLQDSPYRQYVSG